jgi:hypothetical protein
VPAAKRPERRGFAAAISQECDETIVGRKKLEKGWLQACQRALRHQRRSVLKNCRTSSTSAGSSIAAKCPPDFISVQRVTL